MRTSSGEMPGFSDFLIMGIIQVREGKSSNWVMNDSNCAWELPWTAGFPYSGAAGKPVRREGHGKELLFRSWGPFFQLARSLHPGGGMW